MKPIVLTLGQGDATIRCGLQVGKDVAVTAKPGYPAGDTAVYAVCRFLRHNPAAVDRYIYLSYRMRLSAGKYRRARRFCIVAPAALMELPGTWVSVSGTVSPEGLTIGRIALPVSFDRVHRRSPKGRRGGKDAPPRAHRPAGR